MAYNPSAELGSETSLQAMLSVYGLTELIDTVENLKKSSGFLLDLAFRNIVTSQFPEVAIDVDVGKRRMSPFVSPLVEGKTVESRRTQTNLYTPPTLKDLRNPDFLKPIRRQIGERIGGDTSIRARLEENLIFELSDQKDMINRRTEWMAAQALSTGKIGMNVEGEGESVIDFNRDPSLTIALTGNAQWGQPNVSPADSVTNWAIYVMQKSGAMPQNIVFTPSSWQKFISDPKVVNTIFQTALIDPKNDPIVTGARLPNQGGVSMGRWGQFNLWLYADWYVDYQRDAAGRIVRDAQGNAQEFERPMLPDGSVILTGPDLQGTRAYGLIQDPYFNYEPLSYAPKLWYNENPGQINLLMQSAPLPIPSRVNAAFCATVCAPGNGVSGGNS